MPVFEMPLEQLRSYSGRNPRPADFDAYWDRGIRELDSIDPRPELVAHPSPARFAECFDLWFTGVGNARIHCKYVRPRAGGPHPALLEFHGYSANAGDWFDKLPWAAQGIAIAVMEARGQGGLSEDVGGVKGTTLRGHIVRGLGDHLDKLLFRQIFLDAAQMARVVLTLPEVDPRRIASAGASQGGGLAIACAALEPRIVRTAPVFPFLCDYQRVYEMDLAIEAYEELSYYFKRFDPTHQVETEIFTRLGYIDVQHLAHRIQARVLMATALMDTVCPPSSQFAVYNKINSPKEMVLYPDFGHEGLPGHSDRVFAFVSEFVTQKR